MNDIEVGEYVRTRGIIGKLIRIEFDKIDTSLKWYVLDIGKKREVYVNKPYIENHSKNIIDLIEVGDYVNGLEVLDIYFPKDLWDTVEVRVNDKYTNFIIPDDIKSISTKEKFKEGEYVVDD